MNQPIMQDFLDLSSELTCFSVFELYGTGQAAAYLATVEKVVAITLLGDLLSAWRVVKAVPAADRPAELRRQVLGDQKLGPIARNVIKLWYSGTWYELPPDWIDVYGAAMADVAFVVSPTAYTEGLMWTAFGAHPPVPKPRATAPGPNLQSSHRFPARAASGTIFTTITQRGFKEPSAMYDIEKRSGGKTKFDPKKVWFGITPTLWWNDDFLFIDIGIPFEQCVSEMALAGFAGCSIGHKYPTDPCVLKAALDLRGLRVSEPWVSTYFTNHAMRLQTITAFKQQMDFLAQMGATDIVVAEFGGAVNPLPVALFANRPIFDEAQWKALADGLNTLGKMAADEGMRLCYHPHMGTGVMIASEIDKLMQMTDAKLVHLLLDTGHLAFAGADPLKVTIDHGLRIKHIHLKNVRQNIVDMVVKLDLSFQMAVEQGVFTVAGDPDGSIDFPPIFDALAAADFEGWIIVEAEQDPAKATPLKYAKMARAYLLKELGW